MNQPYSPPSLNGSSFNCPHCHAFSTHQWGTIGMLRQNQSSYQVIYGWHGNLISKCNHCGKITLWVADKMIYPMVATAPQPNMDLPDDIKADFEEARQLAPLSPRSAAALLRLCIQKICIHLGQDGKNLNNDIGNLVRDGNFPAKLQQALDAVRVIGNNAVHPGQINLNDNADMVYKLFGFVNIIADVMISQPKQLQEFYDNNLSDSQKASINQRDGNGN